MNSENQYPIPANEELRLHALAELSVLDTAPEQIFDDLTLLAAMVCEAPAAAISFVDSDRDWRKSVFGPEPLEEPRGDSFAAHAILAVDVFTVEDSRLDPRFLDAPSVVGPPAICSYCSVPLVTENGCVAGVFSVMDTVPRTFSDGQHEALRALARQTMAHLGVRRTAQALNDKARLFRHAEESLRYSGLLDTITGLPHRRLFDDRSERALRRSRREGKPVAIMLVELDGCETVTMTLGTAAFDDLLRAVANGLQRSLRESDTVARTDATSFAVLCEGVESRQDARVIAETLQGAAARTVVSGGHTLPISASVGIVIYPTDGDCVATLIRNAQSAARLAKDEAGAGIAFFASNSAPEAVNA